MKPLEGMRVADFSHVMAGPFATHFLRLMGAEVIKIEAPGRGDAMRYYGPDRRYDGMAPGFIAANAGKKSIVLDLKQDAAKDVARRLIAASDVVVENFKPGVIARLGFGYEECRKLRDDIVFCSISGYGQTGPFRDYPAIDNIVQATSGMMSLSGEEDGPPMRVGFPVVDTWVGLTGAFAIMSALLRRERTGKGEYIDVAMFDAALTLMASAFVPYLVTGARMPRTGNTGYSGQPTAALFAAKDGTRISLGVVQANHYAALLGLMGLERLRDDPRYATPDSRRENFAALHGELQAVFRTRDGAAWESVLSEAGLPCGLVRDVADVCTLDGVKARAALLPLTIPGIPNPDVHITGAGFLFGEDGPGVDAPPPRHGGDTEAVLASLGYGPDERASLLKTGAAVQS